MHPFLHDVRRRLAFITQYRNPRFLLLTFLLACVYFAAASLSLQLVFAQAFGQINASPIWLPSGIAIAALLYFGHALWPGVAVGVLLFSLAGGLPLGGALLICIGATLEALVAASLVTHFAERNPFGNVLHVIVFLASALLATAISTTLAIIGLRYSTAAPLSELSHIGIVWWIGDLSGALLIVPLLLTWQNAPLRHLKTRRRVEALAGFSGASALALLLFSGGFEAIGAQESIISLLLLPLIWTALRFRQQAVITLAFIYSVIAIMGTLQGYGPFARESVGESLLLLQTFMCVVIVAALILTASRCEYRAAQRQLQANNLALEERISERTTVLSNTAQKLRHESRLRDQSSRAMYALMEATARQTGESFLRSCVRDLSRVYETRYAFIGVFADDSRQAIKTLAVWAGKNYADNFSCLLASTPCDDVLNLKIELIPDKVQTVYPQDALLVQMGIESYFGIPIIDSNNETMGLVVVMDTKPMSPHPWLIPILGIFANRIALELERSRYEQALELSAAVFNIANEAVVICDQDARILRVNDAFTQTTGYTQDEAIGQTPCLLRAGLYDEEFYRQLRQDIETTGSWQGELWDRRKNGQPFPAWYSITQLKNAGVVQYYVGVFHDITDKKTTEERLYQMAHYDTLTELPNRAAFQDMVTHEIQHAKRHGKHLAMMFLDLDHFKNVNDSLGHHCGDLLLQQIARRLQMTVRAEDFVGRLGGDEFTVLLRDVKCREDIVAVAKKILRILVRPVTLENTEVTVGTSIGISTFPDNGTDAETLLKQADTAMYQAKNRGRNGFAFFTPDMNRQASERITLENELRRALQNDEFILHYQPQITLESGALIGCEALLRWRHPEKGLIAPGEFMRVADESGLSAALGSWVLHSACRQAVQWQRQGFPALHIAVNLSIRQFMRQDFKQVIEDVIATTGIDPSCLDLELTEGMIMREAQSSKTLLQALRDMGVNLSIDDFGTGFSSMLYLQQLPINKLKIDRSFVADLRKGSNDAAIVNAILSLGHDLGLTVIAEGVETLEQLNFLKQHDCDEVQGYYICRPLPSELLGEFLRRHFPHGHFSNNQFSNNQFSNNRFSYQQLSHQQFPGDKHSRQLDHYQHTDDQQGPSDCSGQNGGQTSGQDIAQRLTTRLTTTRASLFRTPSFRTTRFRTSNLQATGTPDNKQCPSNATHTSLEKKNGGGGGVMQTSSMRKIRVDFI